MENDWTEEQEQLSRLEERKLEASILTSDLEDAIIVAKREIDRLVEENKKNIKIKKKFFIKL